MADGSPPLAAFTPSADTTRALRDALGQFATGVMLITITGPDGPLGFVANSFSSLSLDPALVLWSLAKSSRRFTPVCKATHFAIHILSADQAPLMARFNRDGPGFVGLDHQINADGTPVIAGALARLECRQFAQYEGGDHIIIVGQVLHVATYTGTPLVFAQGRSRALAGQD